MSSLHHIIPQSMYAAHLRKSMDEVKDLKKHLPQTELAKFEKFKRSAASIEKGMRLSNDLLSKALAEQDERSDAAKQLMKGLIEARLAKAGVTTATGYNFYDLRAPVQLSFPVNVPFRNALPRIGRVNDGFGTAANWKATRNPGTAYAGVPEGQRSQLGTPDENDYTAKYKEIGVERAVTFTAQFAGEGYADNLADEHLRGLYELWLQEEGLMLLGNSGTASGNNGFAFGTAPTPTLALVATNTAGSLPYTAANTTASYLSVAVVLLTGLGNPSNAQYGYGLFPTIANGLTPSFTYSAPGTGATVTVNGGMSQISAVSAPLQCTTGNLTVKASIPSGSLPIKGCFGYAWFVDVEASATGSLANAKLAGITTTPFALISGTATGLQAGNAAGLNADHSFNVTDFDGLVSYAATTDGAGWTDLQGVSLTSGKNGRINEIETILQSIWTNYQAGVDCIWGSSDAVVSVDNGVRYGGTNPSSYRFDYTRDAQNNLLGGFVVGAYQSRFAMSPNGATAIPIRIHPMIPPGTLYFDVSQNPYPHSRAPFVRGMLVQRDYYSIEWPLVSRQWTFGTYCHEVLAHNFAWIPAVLTGIGPFNFSQ